MTDFSARRAAFRTLHENGCFAIPNPWDAGSAKRLEKLGFKALASSSAAAAWTLGLTDHQITIEQILPHLEILCNATNLPVSADFENGFADDPEDVATNVKRAIATGLAGLSIEDQPLGGGLYPLNLAVERIEAARAAIDASGENVLLIARTEAYLNNIKELDVALERMTAFAAAGADCLFAPGMTDAGEIEATVKAVAPKPVNVLVMNDQMRVPDLARLGVRRVSVGGALAWAAWQGFDKAAAALAEQAL